MRHLVTGGAGFIGAALVNRLVAEDHEVFVIDRLTRGRADRLPDEAILFTGDIRDAEFVQDAVDAADPDVIWHLAYVQGTRTFYEDPKTVIDVALRGVMNVLAAVELRVIACKPRPDMILCSSSEAYQNPPSGSTDESVAVSVPDVTNPRFSYGGGKIASELAVLAYAHAGLLNRTVVVRPHNVYGADMGNDHVIPELATRMMSLIDPDRPRWEQQIPLPIQGSGQETRSFCYITDCVDGLMLLLDRGADRNVYHLGNEQEEYSVARVAHAIADFFDVEAVIQPGVLPKGSPTRRVPNTAKLRELGFRPKVPLIYGLQQTLTWYAKRAEGVKA